MKRSKLTALIIISLAFNVAVLSVFGFFLLHHGDNEPEFGFHPDKSCPGPRECRHFAKKFGLHPERADSFAIEMNKFSGEERELEDRITKARFELMEILRESQPEEKALMNKVGEISNLQGELEKILVKRLLHVNSLLSKSERGRFHKLLQRRMGMRRRSKTFLPPHPETLREGGIE
jgi:hypothetical protein